MSKMDKLVEVVTYLAIVFSMLNVVSAMILVVMLFYGIVVHLGDVSGLASGLLCLFTILGYCISITFIAVIKWEPREYWWLIWLCCGMTIVCAAGNYCVLMRFFTTLQINVYKLATGRFDKELRKNSVVSEDLLYSEYKCCGLNGVEDFETQNMEIPSGCYSETGEIYTRGCVEVLSKELLDYKMIIDIVIAINIFIEMFASICAAILGVAYSQPKKLA